MAREANWDRWGYDTAKGKRGTGWMKFTDKDAEDLLSRFPKSEFPDGIPVEALDEYAYGWFETEQFNYEAGDNMQTWAERESKREDEDDDWIYKFDEKRTAWQMGYVAYMQEVLEKKGVKIDRD